MLSKEIIDLLQSIDNNTLIITLGNDFRCDDGVGCYIYNSLINEKLNFHLLNGGERPENIIDEAITLNPSRVIIIDAANFGGKFGELRIFSNDQINQVTYSTHSISPVIISKILQNELNSPVFFVGIQAKNFSYGEKLSKQIKKTADGVIAHISPVFKKGDF